MRHLRLEYDAAAAHFEWLFFQTSSVFSDPSRLVRSSSPYGYILRSFPPVTYWVGFFSFFVSKCLLRSTLTGIDESHYVCSPLQQKILTIIGTAALFIGAFGVAQYVICVKVNQLKQENKTCTKNFNESEKAQLQNTFNLLRTFQKDPKQPNEDRMKKALKKFSLEMKMALIKVVFITDVRGLEDQTKSLFKRAIHSILATESLRKAHLTYVKVTNCSTELKIKVRLDICQNKFGNRSF